MAEATSIEWTDATWNPITGCSLASPGCTNCYAMKLAAGRLAHHPSRAGLTHETKGGAVWTGEVRFNDGSNGTPNWLTQPIEWKRPRMIFVCAHGDLFHPNVPVAWIDQVFAVMAAAPWHTFQVLTKRAERMQAYLEGAYHCGEHWLAHCERSHAPMWPMSHVWIGVSAEDQTRWDERVPILRQIPAAVRWVSGEPLIGAIDGRRDMAGLDWLVVGGESGPGARPMHPDWARQLRDQAKAAGVPFHFKQYGSWRAVYDRDRDDPDWRRCGQVKCAHPSGRWLNLAGGHGFHGERVVYVDRAPKQVNGRQLDGRTHDGWPSAAKLAA